MLFAEVVDTSNRIAETSKRLAKIDLLATLLRKLQGDEIDIVVPFLSARARQGKLGVGYGALRDAAAEAAAEATLQIADVDRAFAEIAATRGSRARIELLRALLSRATKPEQQFIAGVIGGEIRQGALEGIMVEGVAKASGIPVDRARHAAMLAGDISAIARAALEKHSVDEFRVKLFQPLQPMLAQTADDVSEAIDDLGEAALEYKLDGARIQVHKSGDDVVVFSRALNEVTPAVPEVVEAVRAIPARELILDGEVISLKPDGRPQPFQVTMSRFGRKSGSDALREQLPFTPFWFDLIYKDGADLLEARQSERFAELQQLAPVVPHLTTSDVSKAHEFLQSALAQGHEGIMAKSPTADYAIGARGRTWLKIKHVNTLDLVILAAEWGSGRRKGWLSNLHLGARDAEKGGFAMLGKTFKGLTDEMLAWQTAELLKIEIARDAYTVFVEPKLVAEIAFNEIQVSSRYKSGLALRFARVKRYRPDKSAAESDTFQTVKKLAGAAD
jgi:DNA ligase-1